METPTALRAALPTRGRPAILPAPARPLAVAHRGASARAPENTLAAVRAGVAAGADLVEVDVQRTRDGALVVLHDPTLGRTTDARRRLRRGAPWNLADLTLAQVRALDAGSWKGPAYAGERVPLLSEVVDTLAGTGVGLLLELKKPGLYPGIAADVAHALTGVDLPVVVQSFDVAALKELTTRAPHLPVGVLGQPRREHLPVLATWVDQVNPAYRMLDRGYVAAVQEAGMSCLTWTVDRPTALRRALDLGVDGVITNRPELLVPMLPAAAVNGR